MSDKKIYKPKPISGFPEFLPEVRMVEQQWLDHIRRIFEAYGFCPIETPSVEELDVITAKGGDTDKEIYVIERLHKEEGDKEARLALHFDQTVPFARYVAQHFNDLTFPFKRYQMQKVWRGERPQAGRFREFMQCDIDVINVDNLPLHFDAEIPAIIWEVLSTLPGMENENIQIRISNRKILIGLLEACGIEDARPILRVIDKIDKIGEDSVKELISQELEDPDDIAEIDFIYDVLKNGTTVIPEDLKTEKVQEGIKELEFMLAQLSHLPENAVKMDLSMVRGLDYYTGTVYETVFTDDPGYGSICSGGRYDDLAGSYINKNLPGVGISIGFSRLFARLLEQGKLPVGPSSPADALVLLPDEDQREIMNKTAQTLRKQGLNVETAHGGKLKKQLAYAEKKAIPYVWFPQDSEVKNMMTGEQTKADPESWEPKKEKLNDVA